MSFRHSVIAKIFRGFGKKRTPIEIVACRLPGERDRMDAPPQSININDDGVDGAWPHCSPQKTTPCSSYREAAGVKCCRCLKVPTRSTKIYYGQVFCESCFHQYVLAKQKDNPAQFFRNCMSNMHPAFVERMKKFMEIDGRSSPNVNVNIIDKDKDSCECECGKCGCHRRGRQSMPRRCDQPQEEAKEPQKT